MGLIFGGDVIDVDANSDYGSVFGEFLAEHASAVTRRTTVVVLGDGRNNAKDPNLAAFEEITRRARETVWLTPEPRYSWGLGSCDLPAYAEFCSRVRVVRDLSGLEQAAHDFAAEAVGLNMYRAGITFHAENREWQPREPFRRVGKRGRATGRTVDRTVLSGSHPVRPSTQRVEARLWRNWTPRPLRGRCGTRRWRRRSSPDAARRGGPAAAGC